MPAEIKILLQGYTNADSVIASGEEKTSPTISLVKSGDIIMVVDPGVLRSQQLLIDALAKENLTVADVNFVCITHSHLDHYRNIGMFPNAKTLDYWGVWDKNTVSDFPDSITPDIQVIHTPGHDYTGISLLVNTENGVVAICGDVFWKTNYPADPHDDAFASNPEKLQDSRDEILRRADWIVPGHGEMYKNKSKEGVLPEEDSEKHSAEQKKIVVVCEKCDREMEQKDKCNCRPWLCYRCCECGLDCDNCSCSHHVL